ncbi:hypothetical protein C0Q70_17517 [Pomacea canaliculata]|uniref:Uncharacterized protein n=1 Tax=Pomacea canaliculata TaxID=400727 RepID=A0A2T7NKL4_POMCA|nr:hypothetical protein C0Q70_17517 [Pomacea canaliculata]
MNAFVRIQGSTHLCECYARHICSEPSSLVSMKDNRVCDPSDDEDRFPLSSRRQWSTREGFNALGAKLHIC